MFLCHVTSVDLKDLRVLKRGFCQGQEEVDLPRQG